MITMIIALKGAVWVFFYNLLNAPTLFSTCMLKWPGGSRVQITCNKSGTCEQHEVRHMAQGDSSTIKFDRAEITFISMAEAIN